MEKVIFWGLFLGLGGFFVVFVVREVIKIFFQS